MEDVDKSIRTNILEVGWREKKHACYARAVLTGIFSLTPIYFNILNEPIRYSSNVGKNLELRRKLGFSLRVVDPTGRRLYWS